MKKSIKISYHILSVCAAAASLLIGVFCCRNSYVRLIESVRDFGTSIVYYVCKLFSFDSPLPATVADSTRIPWNEILPVDFARFGAFLKAYFSTFVSSGNVTDYLVRLFTFIPTVAKVVGIGVILVALIALLAVIIVHGENNNYNRDTVPLKIFKTVANATYYPIKRYLVGFFGFLKSRKIYAYILAAIWLANVNVVSIAFALVAALLYLCTTISAVNIFFQCYKLITDIAIGFGSLPLPLWIVVFLVAFDKLRREQGYARLERCEKKNREFIDSLPIATIIIGAMGKRKTTLLTDIVLSKTVMFRDKAYEILLKTDLHFPNFPWLVYELNLRRLMQRHVIYNLATLSDYVKRMQKRFDKQPCKQNIFGYDFERYAMTYNDGLTVSTIWAALETYGKAYLIYLTQSSLLISNFSIREDNVVSDKGNFPMWDNDFFRRKPELIEAQSRNAHILDFDAVRLGHRMNRENAKANYFEFGVICITEIGKERGNKFDTAAEDKKSEKSNRKNDFFDKWIKMIRHSATVDFFPFVFVIGDEQRAMNVGADVREVCDIIYVDTTTSPEIVLPFFTFGEWWQDRRAKKFARRYGKYRHERGDNTLLMRVYKTLRAAYNAHYERIKNTFGRIDVRLRRESGMVEGKSTEQRYYISTKKVFANRFASDCFNGFFYEKALLSPVGLNDVATYAATCAVLSELQSQNSYFIQDVSSCFDAFKTALKKQNGKPKKTDKTKKAPSTKTIGAKCASPQSP